MVKKYNTSYSGDIVFPDEDKILQFDGDIYSNELRKEFDEDIEYFKQFMNNEELEQMLSVIGIEAPIDCDLMYFIWPDEQLQDEYLWGLDIF